MQVASVRRLRLPKQQPLVFRLKVLPRQRARARPVAYTHGADARGPSRSQHDSSCSPVGCANRASCESADCIEFVFACFYTHQGNHRRLSEGDEFLHRLFSSGPKALGVVCAYQPELILDSWRLDSWHDATEQSWSDGEAYRECTQQSEAAHTSASGS